MLDLLYIYFGSPSPSALCDIPQAIEVALTVCELEVTITEGALRQVSEVREEVHYSERLGGYTDGTWL